MVVDVKGQLLIHLTQVENGEKGISAQLIRDFIVLMGLAPYTKESIDELLLKINNIVMRSDLSAIDPENVLLELLQNLLLTLPFEDILSLYGESFILGALDSINPQVLHLVLVLFRIKIHECGTFLRAHNLISKIIHKYFEDKKLSISVVREIERLVEALTISDQSLSLLLTDDLIKLYKEVRYSNDAIMYTRFLEYTKITQLVTYEAFPAVLINFSLEELLASDDPLFVSLLINYYNDLVASLDQTTLSAFEMVSPSLSTIFSIWHKRQQNDALESFCLSEIVNLFATLSKSQIPQVTEFFRDNAAAIGLFKGYHLYLHSSLYDIRLLSLCDPIFFGGGFYEDVLDTIPLLNEKYFSITLNIIQSPELLSQLASNEKLTVNTIKNLPADMVYSLIFHFAKYDVSSQFLLDELPSIVETYLVKTPNELNDVVVWNLRQEALKNLLTQNHLGDWGPRLAQSYSLMVNGRNVHSIIPQVTIEDTVM